MPRIKRVKAKHVERLVRQIWLHDFRDVAIVPEGHMNIFQTAVRLVNAVLRLVLRHMRIWIATEVFGEDDLIRPRTAHRECVPDNSPLRFAVQAETLS